jgi:hypothetical protein
MDSEVSAHGHVILLLQDPCKVKHDRDHVVEQMCLLIGNNRQKNTEEGPGDNIVPS